jgi:hypothetical protein
MEKSYIWLEIICYDKDLRKILSFCAELFPYM